MKEVFITYPVNWIAGHLRYGHKEGNVEMSDEEFYKFEKNPTQYLKEHSALTDDLDLLVDDWEVDDYDNEIEDIEYRVKA